MRFLCNTHSSISTCNSNKHAKQPFKLKKFSYADLESSTNGFSPRALLGKGSHGAVYRAHLPTTSVTVAVKNPTSSLSQTAENELQILSNLRSRRIVNLIGYSYGVDSTKLLLIVQYMPNGSLYDSLHKPHHHHHPPGLSNRVRVALQVAKAVRTLHNSNPPVIHRDIKSSNVLIDERGNARLSDFGLAIKRHVEDAGAMCTPPAGTLGYLDPCYLAPGDLSTKSDVFSFGILLLEILSGRKAIDVEFSPPSLVDWALPLIMSRDYHQILDRRIRGRVDQTVVRELALLAARCVRSMAEKRPSVLEIVDCLTKVYRRIKLNLKLGIHVWNNLRRKKERSQPLDEIDGGNCDESRMMPRVHGSEEVSNVEGNMNMNINLNLKVDSSNQELTCGVHQKVRSRLRSKSIGSFMEVKRWGQR
ncbi:hypothetical protein RDABS01_008796 [Bienertia sinuspersici]